MMVTGKICRYVDAKLLCRCCALKFEAVDEVVIARLVFLCCYGDVPCQSVSHCWSRYRSACSSCAYSGPEIHLCSRQTSANNLRVDETQSGRSLMNIINRRGPRTVP